MSHQDLEVALKGDCLKQAIRWLLAGISWSSVKFRDDCTYTPQLLACTAMLWAWSNEPTLVDRFQATRSIIKFLFPLQRELAGSYQAFMKLLHRWTAVLIALVQEALRQRMQRTLDGCWEVDGFVMFGVDGSRIELPRTRSHEAAYSAARLGKPKKQRQKYKTRSQKHAKKANSPQMWLTTMWHAGTGLPWDWRTGPADSSERAHMLDMLPALPEGALIAADAGFVGYEFAKAVIHRERELLVRVGSNVRLLRKLGFVRESQGTVYLWPDQQAKRDQPPIVLRMVVAQNGKHPVYLLTSVRCRSRLSDRQVVTLYRRRWGIEVFYRHFKQTFGRRKLRSNSADNAQIEIQWSLAGLWAMGLYALVQIVKQGFSPNRLSIAETIRTFRNTLRDYRHVRQPAERLCTQLRDAVTDAYIRQNKASRAYPRKKQESPPGAPKIITANKFQIQHAKQIATINKQKGLTA